MTSAILIKNNKKNKADINKLTAFFATLTSVWRLNRNTRIQDVLRRLVPFVQLKQPQKHAWMSVILSNVAGFSQQLY